MSNVKQMKWFRQRLQLQRGFHYSIGRQYATNERDRMIPSSGVIKSHAVLVDEFQSERLIYIMPRYDTATK